MGSAKVEDIDHLGIVAGVIQDLGIIGMIDYRITPDEREEITTGEAIAGMIINGLGFSDRPMTLTPQFFEGKALDVLIREGITPDRLNRFKLGRSDSNSSTILTANARAKCQADIINIANVDDFSITSINS